MEEIQIEKISDHNFHGIDYIVRIYAKEHNLTIELEQKQNGDIWRNQFSSQYIEEITQKAGLMKTYGVFLKMLLNAIQNNNSQVSIDVLTQNFQIVIIYFTRRPQDLTNLRQKKSCQQDQQYKSGQNSPNNSQIIKQKNFKRYFILSYMHDQEKSAIYYPMPLDFDEEPSVYILKNTLRRFRLEIEELKLLKQGNYSGNQGIDGNQVALNLLRNENEILRNKVKRLEDASTQRIGAVEVEQLYKKNLDLESQLETQKNQSKREITRLQQQLEDSEKELMEKKTELHQLKCEYASILDNEDGCKNLQNKLIQQNEKNEVELLNYKKTILKQLKDLENLSIENEQYKQTDKKQKIRIKQLEFDLENALKRQSHKVITERLYNNYSRASSRGNSPAHQNQQSRASSRGSSIQNTPTNRTTLYSKKPLYQTPIQSKTYTQKSNQNLNRRTPSQNKNYSQNKYTPKSSSLNNNMQSNHSSAHSFLNQKTQKSSGIHAGNRLYSQKINQNVKNQYKNNFQNKYNQVKNSYLGGGGGNSNSKYNQNQNQKFHNQQNKNQIRQKYGIKLNSYVRDQLNSEQSPIHIEGVFGQQNNQKLEEEELLQKLEDLKQKNKENQIQLSAKNKRKYQILIYILKSKAKNQNYDSSQDIDARLNKLQNLLRQVKN